MVERGGGQERDSWRRLIDQRPDVDIGALWRACSYVRREVRDVVARIAGRVRVVAFTNDMAHWFGDDWRQRFAELAAFDDVLEAAALGVLKPAPEAFVRAAAAIGEDPAHCLLVDDLPANLAGAAAVGMADPALRRPRPAAVDRRAVRPPGTGHRRRLDAPRVRAATTREPVMATGPDARLAELGLTLPQLRPRAGNYVGWCRVGDLLFLAGQGADGWVGRVGDRFDLGQARAAAR